jgi:hypothetical protein
MAWFIATITFGGSSRRRPPHQNESAQFGLMSVELWLKLHANSTDAPMQAAQRGIDQKSFQSPWSAAKTRAAEPTQITRRR